MRFNDSSWDDDHAGKKGTNMLLLVLWVYILRFLATAYFLPTFNLLRVCTYSWEEATELLQLLRDQEATNCRRKLKNEFFKTATYRYISGQGRIYDEW